MEVDTIAEEGSIIEVNNLSYWYPDQKEPSLRDINLIVKRGELVVVIGPSGCGKSTLALLLNGIIPTVMGGRIKGSVEVSNLDTFKQTVPEMARKVTLVLQDPESQICNLYVRDEIAFGPQNLLFPRELILDRVDRAMSFVGLKEFEHRSVFGLSGGEKQRVAIASGLVMEPELIIFDEPTANLDPQGTNEIMSLIGDLKSRGDITILLIEHNIDKIVHIADRLVVMDEGRILHNGNPREILKNFGRILTDKHGLWIPQICEIGLGARQLGYDIGFPLTVEEVKKESLTPLKFLDGSVNILGTNQESGTLKDEKSTLIKTENVGFVYPDGTQALDDVSIKVSRGSTLAIMGQNGSGKSTLCSLFVGLRKPSEGKVEVCGIDASQASIRELAKKVGYVFQYPEHQFLTDNVLYEVIYGLKATGGYHEEQMREKALGVLKLFGLENYLDHHPFRLSLGQRRRLSIATMLVLDPEVLILDEPTSGQDRRNVENLMHLLREKTENELTIIIITHDLDLVGRFATDVLAMENGKVAFDGKPGKLFRQIEDEGLPQALESPDTYRFVRKLQELDLDPPDAYCPEDFLRSLAPSSSAQSGATRR